MSESAKVSPAHLRRRAYVYVRQSTSAQVEHNRESTERQYRLVERAASLGWRSDQVTVIDEDLGVSGGGLVERAGYRVEGLTYFNTVLFPAIAGRRLYKRWRGDNRHDLPHRRLRWRRLKQARDCDENATDRDQTRSDTNKRLEPGQCGTERRETLPESHQAAGRPGGSGVARRRCHGSALSLFDGITAPTRHTAATPCKQGKCRAPTMNFLGRYRRKPPWTRQNDTRLGSRLPSRQRAKEGQCESGDYDQHPPR